MACAEFFRSQNLTLNSSITEIREAVYNSGIGCVNANQASCNSDCADLTKTATRCYACLGNPATCSDAEACRNKQVNCAAEPNDSCCPQASPAAGCCPDAQSAIQCGSCVSRTGSQDVSGFQECLKNRRLGHKTIIIIAVTCAVAVLIVVVVVVLVVRFKRRARERAKLVKRLGDQGLAKQVGQLNLSRINASTFKAVNTQLAIQQANARAAKQKQQRRQAPPSPGAPDDIFNL